MLKLDSPENGIDGEREEQGEKDKGREKEKRVPSVPKKKYVGSRGSLYLKRNILFHDLSGKLRGSSREARATDYARVTLTRSRSADIRVVSARIHLILRFII